VIFRNRRGQVTGNLLPDKVYLQPGLIRRLHSFNSRGELAIDTAHLNTLRELGAVLIRKVFQDTGETFEATPEAFAEHGYEKQWSADDGMQTFLAEKYWAYRHTAQPALF
jgi:hypothetical protein